MTDLDPFADLAAALRNEIDTSETEGVRIDGARRRRTGAPEVIYGKGKTGDQIAVALRRLVQLEGRALAARVDGEQARFATEVLATEDVQLDYDEIGAHSSPSRLTQRHRNVVAESALLRRVRPIDPRPLKPRPFFEKWAATSFRRTMSE